MIPNEKSIVVRFNTFPSKFNLDVPLDKSDLNDKQIEGPKIHVNLKVEKSTKKSKVLEKCNQVLKIFFEH